MAGSSVATAIFRRPAMGGLGALLLLLPLLLWPLFPAGTRSAPGRETGQAGRETLLQATLRLAEDVQLELRLLRITLAPNGRSPWHAHSGLEFGVLETGQLLVQVDGPAIRRGADPGAEGAAIAEGDEVALSAGDRIAYGPGTDMTFRNPGSDPAVLLAATVLPVGADVPPGVVYRDGPPSPEDNDGVSSQILGDATIDAGRFSDAAIAVVLERLTAAGGEALPAFAGPVLLAVDQGGLTGELVEGSAAVVSAQGGETDAPRFALGPGEALFFPEGMAATAPLGGNGGAVFFRLGLVPLEQDVVVIAGARETAAPGASTESGDAGTAGAEDRAGSAAPFAPGSTVVVAVDEARLRAEPATDAALVAALERDRRLLVVGPPVAADGHDWYPVEDLADPSLSGYVAGDLLASA